MAEPDHSKALPKVSEPLLEIQAGCAPSRKEAKSMKDLSETAVSLLLSFLGLMIAYSIFGEILSGFITQSFDLMGGRPVG